MHQQRLNPTADPVNTPAEKHRLTRRDFLISIGAGAAICGYVLLGFDRNIDSAAESTSTSDPARPMLKRGVTLEQSGDVKLISSPGSENGEAIVVNETGALVLELMDGSRTIEQISSDFASNAGISKTAALDAGVASFAAKVSMAGLLVTPFFAVIYRTEMTA